MGCESLILKFVVCRREYRHANIFDIITCKYTFHAQWGITLSWRNVVAWCCRVAVALGCRHTVALGCGDTVASGCGVAIT